jgi:hypothetical protein
VKAIVVEQKVTRGKERDVVKVIGKEIVVEKIR